MVSQHSNERVGSRFMLLPSLACQANCGYCFGPNRGPSMPSAVFEAALDWIEATALPGQKIEITFHGGEPLLAGYDWYRQTLPLLKQRFGSRLKLHLQSNLWLLDAPFCQLLKAYRVSIGASLDGPAGINDLQRGRDYFRRTMQGIKLARRAGLAVGVICTFTAASAPHYREILDFFAAQGISLSLHTAACALNGDPAQASFALTPEAEADLLEAALDYYLANLARMQISTFDAIARSISTHQGGICTFGHCLGEYLAVGPDGAIYPCNRFVSHREWQLGYVQTRPTDETLSRSAAWQTLHHRQLTIQAACGDCPHFAYCAGGCPHNAFANGSNGRDPACPAYRRLFDRLIDRAVAETLAEENLKLVVENGPNRHGLFQKGDLLQLMRAGPHPKETAAKARETVAAVALAVSYSPAQAVTRLDQAGLVTNPHLARQSLESLQNRLRHQTHGLANLYLHVTYACNLRCDHCYARSGPDRADPPMPVTGLASLLRQAAETGFAKAIITGGEPLCHPQPLALLETLAKLCQSVKPMKIVLRTNLAYDLSPALMTALLNSADQILASLDGDRPSHEARRGPGTYDRIAQNLRNLRASGPNAELGITATLSSAQIEGPPGQAVRRLAQELGLAVRFKPELPLGRAAKKALPLTYHPSPEDDSLAQVQPAATCGLGLNLYVGPEGDCYPCHALMTPRHYLGNLFAEGVASLVAAAPFQRYKEITVDSNRQCRRCYLRYLCGGFCRAWSRDDDPNAPPVDCSALHRRAGQTLLSALERLAVNRADWLAAGLPLPPGAD